jgi:hypothetical protein
MRLRLLMVRMLRLLMVRMLRLLRLGECVGVTTGMWM